MRNLISVFLVLQVLSLKAYSQNAEQSSQYVSPTDESVSIKSISILPVTDNLEGIYSRPLEAELIKLVEKNHKWDYLESQFLEIPSLVDLEENPSLVAKLTHKMPADALLACRITKNPNGVTLKLDLFLKSDHLLLAQEILKDYPRFEISELKEKLSELFTKLTTKIPYSGVVLSRNGNRVTINIGKADGITKDQVLSVVQIIKLNRHPKFHFLISSEKEILGKIKVLKVDDFLSFGAIITEKEKLAIQKGAKISGIDFVNYAAPDELEGASQKQDNISDRQDSKLSFGKAPTEWVPIKPPMFGSIELKLGIGSYSESMNLTNTTASQAVGNLDGKTSLFPSLGIAGELWFNPKWQMRAEIIQGVLSVTNPRTNSTPGTLNQSMGYYSLAFGYNFLLRNDFFGPKLRLDMGFMSYRMYVDSSTPEAFTTTNYTGFLAGVTGILPVDDQMQYYIGATLNLVLLPSLSEQPEAAGGSASNNVNNFSIFVEKKLKENIRLKGSLDFMLLSTNYSGQGGRSSGEYATSASQKINSFGLGASYLF